MFQSQFDAMHLFVNSLTLDTIPCQPSPPQLVVISGLLP